MASYRVWHRTTYTYDDPVTICHNLAHLLPRRSPRHEWHGPTLEITPEPATLDRRMDFFGNPLTFFSIQEPHRVLKVTARSQVLVEPPEQDGPACQAAWDQARPKAMVEPGETRLQAMQFLFESPYVRWNDEVAAYAAESFTADRPIVDAAVDLTHRIHRDFVYDPRATTVSTTVAELMSNRRGVCQDLAHLQAACFRSMGLAARYVSGYLLTTPPAGRSRLIGADASHAWVSLYVPGAGWLDFDPTNDLRPGDKHLTIAWGRDYGDVCPLRGVILGGGTQSVQVNVDVSPVA